MERRISQSGSTGTNLSETSRKRVLSVAYWRFFVNALLILCDMASFIVASAIIYMCGRAGKRCILPVSISILVCGCMRLLAR